MVKIYNTTIRQLVNVPEECVAAYLKDPRYLALAPVVEESKEKVALEDLAKAAEEAAKTEDGAPLTP